MFYCPGFYLAHASQVDSAQCGSRLATSQPPRTNDTTIPPFEHVRGVGIVAESGWFGGLSTWGSWSWKAKICIDRGSSAKGMPHILATNLTFGGSSRARLSLPWLWIVLREQAVDFQRLRETFTPYKRLRSQNDIDFLKYAGVSRLRVGHSLECTSVPFDFLKPRCLPFNLYAL